MHRSYTSVRIYTCHSPIIYCSIDEARVAKSAIHTEGGEIPRVDEFSEVPKSDTNHPLCDKVNTLTNGAVDDAGLPGVRCTAARGLFEQSN